MEEQINEITMQSSWQSAVYLNWSKYRLLEFKTNSSFICQQNYSFIVNAQSYPFCLSCVMGQLIIIIYLREKSLH